MERIIKIGIMVGAFVAVWGVVELGAQGRGGAVWTTSQSDAQRTSWVRTDSRISAESVSDGALKFLWSRQLESPPGPLTQPVFSTSGYITYKGFKGLAYVGGARDNIYSLDYDLNKMFWTVHLGTAATTAPAAGCSSGLTSITRLTNLAPPGGGGRNGGAGRGAAAAAGGPPAGAARGAVPAPAAGGAPAQAGRGAAPAGRAGGGGGGGGFGRGGSAAVYAVSTGGMLHIVNPQTGEDLAQPLRLLAGANAQVTGTLYANDMFYATTSGACGGVASGLYAMNLSPAPPPEDAPPVRGPVPPNMTPADSTVRRWLTNGGGVVGPAGVALAPDGRAFVATGAGERSATARSNALVAVDGSTLSELDYFSAGDSPFVTSPVVFELGDRTLVAAANRDGRLYLLDAASLGGADHMTPLARSAPYASSQPLAAGTVSTFEADGTRWLLVASAAPLAAGSGFRATNGPVSRGTVLAFRVAEVGASVALQPAWASRDLAAPAAPTIVNDVVFALATGQDLSVPATEAARGTGNAVLYALDAQTGRELWTSGTTIASFVPGVAPVANDSQVYVVGNNGTMYVFGTEVDR